MIQLKQYSDEELLKMQNSSRTAISLTPKEKFERAANFAKTKGSKFRKFHFKAIVSGTRITVFNGLGLEIGSYEDTIAGNREARIICNSLFCKATGKENINGGYSFTRIGGVSLELLNEKETEIANELVRKNLAYKSIRPPKTCRHCEFEFAEIDFIFHSCTVGESWVVFGAVLVKRKNRGN